MKKYMGIYTNEAAKALKGSERIICRVTDDGAIYVTNGFIAYKMNPPEYAAIVQPVTCCEADKYPSYNDCPYLPLKEIACNRPLTAADVPDDLATD